MWGVANFDPCPAAWWWFRLQMSPALGPRPSQESAMDYSMPSTRYEAGRGSPGSPWRWATQNRWRWKKTRMRQRRYSDTPTKGWIDSLVDVLFLSFYQKKKASFIKFSPILCKWHLLKKRRHKLGKNILNERSRNKLSIRLFLRTFRTWSTRYHSLWYLSAHLCHQNWRSFIYFSPEKRHQDRKRDQKIYEHHGDCETCDVLTLAGGVQLGKWGYLYPQCKLAGWFVLKSHRSIAGWWLGVPPFSELETTIWILHG